MSVVQSDQEQRPLLSVIVVSWNAWEDLSNCLASIFNSKLNGRLEVIIVDNASTDGTAGHVKTQYPDASLIENKQNLGHTVGVNQGFDVAVGEYILVLDADTEFSNKVISGMLDFMQSHPDVCLSTPRTLNTDGSIQESARNLPSVMSGLFGRQSKLTEWFPNNFISRRYLARQHLDNMQPFQVEQISAAFMLFPRGTLDEVGKWDERYPGYWVDTDWCAHIMKCKKKIYCVPQYEITHHENNAKDKPKSARRIWMFHYGAYILYSKWYSFGRFDPRAILALMLLSTRALLLIISNVKKKMTYSECESLDKTNNV